MEEYPYRLNVVTPPGEDNDPYAEGPFWTERAAGVKANMQPLGGSVQQSAAGRQVDADWKGFVPYGTPIEVDDGVELVSGPGAPLRLRVKSVAPWGEHWDTELLLEQTAEEFPRG